MSLSLLIQPGFDSPTCGWRAAYNLVFRKKMPHPFRVGIKQPLGLLGLSAASFEASLLEKLLQLRPRVAELDRLQ